MPSSNLQNAAVLSVLCLAFLTGSCHGLRRLSPADLYDRSNDIRDENLSNNNNNNGWSRNTYETKEEDITRTLKPGGSPKRPSSPDEHLVTSLPYLNEEDFRTDHYAGHLPASSDDDKAFFYWLFAPDFTEVNRNEGGADTIPKEDEENAPILIWLNGGPACSSMDGLFLENGPFRLHVDKETGDNDNGQWKIKVNPHSWHKAPAWTVYVDQPVGTGLSYTRYKHFCKTQDEISADFYFWLREFLWLYGDLFLKETENGGYVLKRELYFAGESHAGIYIPSIIDYILKQNEVVKNDEEVETSTPEDGAPPSGIEIPVAGGTIGNGIFDHVSQCSNAEVAYGLGLIDMAQKAHMDVMEAKCMDIKKSGNMGAFSKCIREMENQSDKTHNQAGGNNSKIKISPYDSRVWEKVGIPRSYPQGHKIVESFLGGWPVENGGPPMQDYKKTLEAIHATKSIEADQRYQECTDPAFYALVTNGFEYIRDVVDEIVRILDHPSNVRLLFFNGVLDLMCDHVGNEKALNRLPWSERDSWVLHERNAWDPWASSPEDTGKPAGYVKQHKNLAFLKVLDAGHMVPMDVPDVCLEMIRVFMKGGHFDKRGQQQIDMEDPDKIMEKCKECDSCEAEVEKAVAEAKADAEADDEVDYSMADDDDDEVNAIDTPTIESETQSNQDENVAETNTDITITKQDELMTLGSNNKILIGGTLVVGIILIRLAYVAGRRAGAKKTHSYEEVELIESTEGGYRDDVGP